MPRWSLSGVFVDGLLFVFLLPSPTTAASPLSWLPEDGSRLATESLGRSGRVATARPDAPPAPEFITPVPSHGYPPGPCAYPWGYFGARSRPVRFCHKSYYGDCCWVRHRRPGHTDLWLLLLPFRH